MFLEKSFFTDSSKTVKAEVVVIVIYQSRGISAMRCLCHTITEKFKMKKFLFNRKFNKHQYIHIVET